MSDQVGPLPDDAIVTLEISIAHYIGDDGVNRWAYTTSHDADSSTLVGLLELVKADVIAEAREGK